MFYRLAADFAVLIHFLWIVFLIVGALIGRRYHAVKVIHISGLTFSIVMQIFGWDKERRNKLKDSRIRGFKGSKIISGLPPWLLEPSNPSL